MKNYPIAIALAVALAAPSAVHAKGHDQAAADVMAAARQQWAAEMENRPMAEQMSTVADDYTEFNPQHPTRIDGKDAATRLFEGYGDSTRSVAADMMNPKVQLYGDVAILSYNYVGLTRDSEGKVTPSNAKSTRIYHRRDGKWMLVHANFAPVMLPQN